MTSAASPEPRFTSGSLTGLRGALTVWLPGVVLAATLLWWLLEGVPLWWSAPALTVAGDPAVRLVLEIARDTETAERARLEHLEQLRADPVLSAPQPEPSEQEEQDAPPLRGGLVIGVLERIAVSVCVISGYATGIAVVVAIKGLARYGEFTSPSQREQFIIGTLASLLWAAGTAGLVLLVSPVG